MPRKVNDVIFVIAASTVGFNVVSWLTFHVDIATQPPPVSTRNIYNVDRRPNMFYTRDDAANLFYKSTVRSVLCYRLICWGGSISVKNRVLLGRVVRSASKTTDTTLPTVDEVYEICTMKKQGTF